jgi:DNA-binding response OmpR family regulator
VVRKELIFDKVYGLAGRDEPENADQVVRTQMWDLRKRLKRHGIKIETIYGVGYKVSGVSAERAKSLVKDVTS